jgi:hypothetical protein
MQISSNRITPVTYVKKWQLFLSNTHLSKNSRNPFIRTLVILIANYPERLGPSGKFVENLQNQIALKLSVIGSNTVQSYGF